MLTTPIPTPLPGPSPRIRSWRVSRASHKAPRPPKPHNLCHEPLLQDTRVAFNNSLFSPGLESFTLYEPPVVGMNLTLKTFLFSSTTTQLPISFCSRMASFFSTDGPTEQDPQ